MRTRKVEEQPEDADGFDLVATGSSGGWSVFLDETHSEPRKYFLQISGPSLYLSCAVSAHRVVEDLLRYLQEPVARDPSFRLGMLQKARVRVRRDAEDSRRCFLIVGGSGQVTRFLVAGEDLVNLTGAIGQAREELADEGLLEDTGAA